MTRSIFQLEDQRRASPTCNGIQRLLSQTSARLAPQISPFCSQSRPALESQPQQPPPAGLLPSTPHASQVGARRQRRELQQQERERAGQPLSEGKGWAPPTTPLHCTLPSLILGRESSSVRSDRFWQPSPAPHRAAPAHPTPSTWLAGYLPACPPATPAPQSSSCRCAQTPTAPAGYLP